MNAGQVTDFIILSALQQEHQAVLGELRPQNEGISEFNGIYVSLPGAGVDVAGFAIPMPASGRLGAALLASRVVARYQPRILLLVGVAGGFESAGVRYGDVLVATAIVDYEHQKITPAGAELRLKQRSVSSELVSCMRRVATSDWWGLPPAGSSQSSPSVYFGPLMSGEKVVASAQFSETLRKWCPNALGVEMEGAGVAAALEEGVAQFAMIRAVGDLADEYKSDDHFPVACRSAAKFAVATLSAFFVPPVS